MLLAGKVFCGRSALTWGRKLKKFPGQEGGSLLCLVGGEQLWAGQGEWRRLGGPCRRVWAAPWVGPASRASLYSVQLKESCRAEGTLWLRASTAGYATHG